MTVYNSRANQPLKWIVALVVFILAMGVTFSDVYGFSRDRAGGNDWGGHHHRNRPGDGGGTGGSGGSGGTGSNDNPTPTAVPEPGTLVLLAGGLSALYVARRMKKDK